MADPQKLRLTFLWADKPAVDADFAHGYSKQLVDWASRFYGQYGLELDVSPKPGDRDAAYRHALAPLRGYERDMAEASEHIARFNEKFNPVKKDWFAVINKNIDLEIEMDRLQAEAQQAMAQFSGMPRPDWPLHAANLLIATVQWRTLSEQLRQGETRAEELRARMQAIHQEFAFDQDIRNYDLPARKAIGARIVAGIEKRARAMAARGGRGGLPADDPESPDEESNISSELRLKVLFCRFQRAGAIHASGADAGPQQYGVTVGSTVKTTDADGSYLYGESFIFVNVLRHERITLAHEMLHAAGRAHRADFDRMKKISEIIAGIEVDLPGRKITLPTFFERVEGAYYDGPDDDIMNYHSKGKAPEDVKLYNEALMRSSFFGRKP